MLQLHCHGLYTFPLRVALGYTYKLGSREVPEFARGVALIANPMARTWRQRLLVSGRVPPLSVCEAAPVVVHCANKLLMHTVNCG